MVIYKTINLINGRWYIGKHQGNDPYYLGSGKILKQAIKKYGRNNFRKIVLEEVDTVEELNIKESLWIDVSDALTDPMSYNLVDGGTGGDRSKFIDYKNRKINDPGEPFRNWRKNTSKEILKEWNLKQGMSRSKGWFVSRLDDPNEIFIRNITKWCREQGIDSSIPCRLNDINSKSYQKQVKGWRIRREGMPLLPIYVDARHLNKNQLFCKGKTWKVINSKRVWVNKN